MIARKLLLLKLEQDLQHSCTRLLDWIHAAGHMHSRKMLPILEANLQRIETSRGQFEQQLTYLLACRLETYPLWQLLAELDSLLNCYRQYLTLERSFPYPAASTDQLQERVSRRAA
ncbi:MAG TPA: hypothetical protein V6D23_14555 [Candidatus Obscuribacterales bacterium]